MQSVQFKKKLELGTKGDMGLSKNLKKKKNEFALTLIQVAQIDNFGHIEPIIESRDSEPDRRKTGLKKKTVLAGFHTLVR